MKKKKVLQKSINNFSKHSKCDKNRLKFEQKKQIQKDRKMQKFALFLIRKKKCAKMFEIYKILRNRSEKNTTKINKQLFKTQQSQ